jgi:hypothetical protein
MSANAADKPVHHAQDFIDPYIKVVICLETNSSDRNILTPSFNGSILFFRDRAVKAKPIPIYGCANTAPKENNRFANFPARLKADVNCIGAATVAHSRDSSIIAIINLFPTIGLTRTGR